MTIEWSQISDNFPPSFPKSPIDFIPIFFDSSTAFRTFALFPEVEIANNKSPLTPKAFTCLENISSKLNTLYLIIIFCLILNATSFFQTIYESHVSANIRYENFKIFKESCLNRINPNKDVVLEKNFYKLKNYHTTNIPPFPNVENLENYKNYVNSDLCDKTIFYFK